jgi:hypothetical protein
MSRLGFVASQARITVSTTPSSGSNWEAPSRLSPAAAVESWIGLFTMLG